jgi:PiT family inorganic phosphate transporter
MATTPTSPDSVGATGAAIAEPSAPTWLEMLPTPRAAGMLAAAVLILLATALSGRAFGGADLLLPAGLALMVALAYANGANDVSKAIATLVGGGVTNERRAIAWGTLCTVLGSLASAAVAAKLIGTFTSGFLASGVQQTEVFALAILVGAILWVAVATRTGLPVSTTHAITGALVTAGAFAYGAGSVQWASLVQKVALPLALSPVLALVVALGVYYITRFTLARLLPGSGSGRVLNGLHWLSSGTASFARGLNDTPKIVALGVAFSLITRHTVQYAAPFWLFALVALGMGAGSFVGGLEVTQTLAEKVTRMNHTEGLAANLVTAFLVADAANLGLPVSTTHVSTGAIIGIGLRGRAREGVRRVDWGVVRGMILAWIVTLPAAGVLAVAAYVALALVHGA